MKAVQIRNVPDGVHRELARRAAGAGRSLSGYLLKELERLAGRPPMAEVLARADARAGGARAEAIVSAVRGDREER